MKKYRFPVLIEKDEDGIFIAKVPDIPGCHTQAKTIPELLKRIQVAVELCLEVRKSEKKLFHPPEFIGIQQVEAII
jgi:predicted RNase H-like HicB family nuclease